MFLKKKIGEGEIFIN